ncbi:IclR family transcriptional regulator [Ramlibacter sp. USB13]|uniref:IclR family transcriptional regulator n=1 Tax=Ramlibacter cellulosilyticus TaxID=2764187 RepID=A0A923MP52_9BURK|nr:IclR family transcriptional regulator [Ramlibacter cellulosilyticus]MBC5782301.1 IclR family transcriptional regulator [Ramlibacter cellulosilyticus]
MTNSAPVPSGTVDRALRILEALAAQPEGLSLGDLSKEVNLPRSACHRLLADLARCGYVRQLREMGDYALTMRLPALGLSFLAGAGIVDIAQPIIDRLAEASGELVRLALVDGDRLTFVAKAQGARGGLRYDPDMGIDVRLSCSAAGHAWLMTLSEERATELVARQGLGSPREYGPKAPTTFKALMKVLEEDRNRGFSVMSEMYAPGMSAMAAPVLRRGREAVGVLTIAGPLQRLTEARMRELGRPLVDAAGELAIAATSSPVFRARATGMA